MSGAEKGSLAAALAGVVSGVSFMVAGTLLVGLLLAGFSALYAGQVWITATYHRMFTDQRRAADRLGKQLMAEIREPSRL